MSAKTGLLALLRKRGEAPKEEPNILDDSKFAARSSAVAALESAVAAGPTPEKAKDEARGRIVPRTAEYSYDVDVSISNEAQPELTVRRPLLLAAVEQAELFPQMAYTKQKNCNMWAFKVENPMIVTSPSYPCFSPSRSSCQSPE
jgi:hypothetical protein